MPLQVKKVQLKVKDGNQYVDGDMLFNVDAEAWARGKRNGQTVPSTDPTYHNNAEYFAQQAATSAAAADQIVFTGNLAPLYSSSSAYEIGDYVMYNDALYECTTAIPSPGEAFNVSHWQAVMVSDIKEQVDNIIVVNEQAQPETKVQIETTDEDVDIALMSDLATTTSNLTNLINAEQVRAIADVNAEEARAVAAETDEYNRAVAAQNLKINKPIVNGQPSNGTIGQLLSSKGNGQTQWTDYATPDYEQVHTAMEDLLENNPSWRADVQDGSLTSEKFSDTLTLEAIKDYVTPQMYGYTNNSSDVGYFINQALAENDTVFIPDGIYKITTTVNLFGENLIVYGGKYHQTKGKSVIFSPRAIFDVRADINVFDVSGNANLIKGGLIDLTTIGQDYTHSVIYLHSENSNTPCFGNKIEGIYISNANNAAKGTGIKLYVSGSGYIYSNIVENVKLQKLEYGIQFTGSSTNGMNSNMFINISYWSCTQCAIITGSGNTFTGIGQCGSYRDVSDDSACFYVGGNNNIIDVFVFDVGNSGLTKYIYELSEDAYANVLRYNGQQAYIGNNKLNKFLGIEKDKTPFVLARNSSNYIYDYSITGSNKFNISNFDGCFDANNFLNTELVSNIECETSSGITITNLGIALDNLSKLKELAKTTSKSYIQIRPEAEGTYSLQIKYTFNFAGISSDYGNIEYFALKTNSLYNACAKNISTITVKQVMTDDTELTMTDLTPLSNSAQISAYRVFKTNTTYSSKRIKNLIINITVNATGRNNASILFIDKLYATFVGINQSGDSYNGIANRSGDTIFGDYLFTAGHGVILTSPNGTKYKLSVANNGTLSTSVVT